ncbi:zinc finger SWIM domain-containing protein 8 homolog isoform X2 [Bacillus rossius redtenbacheri]|uniref:zinc finger SWIM domain-containing protein 8 homolog isoform X2 n=1 Tax=Bacillus rossius redtenbacheri TaxID=93214 RepID=UPI002FDD8060
MLEWEDTDRFSFEDSDRFEEDSLCSWSSEPESLCNNWRGWKRPFGSSKKSAEDGAQVPTLSELTARCVAAHIPFELVEHVYPPVPEQLQLRIAYWSFPDNEEDIRLYSCLANGSSDEFQRGENLYRLKAVKDPLQIGFHLSASVAVPPSLPGQTRGQYNVAVTFDRRRITSCNCTCSSTAYWCSHVVAVCLHRIHLPTQVCLRAPVSESLSRLERDQLQKFAQYLISELPQQILPTAQKILDDLLSSQSSTINSVCGAPDPTAGASANDQTSWYLDEKTLHDNIKKILIKFCIPAPIVFSDVNYLSNSAPPAAAEWTSLLRPLRGREPEGMWNLLSIAREMFKRNDRNAVPLLEIITEECMACEQILVWWFNTKVALHNGSSGHSGGKHGSVSGNSHASQHACSSLCDEIVVLWRLAALNPGLSSEERELLHDQFRNWHLKIVEKVTKTRGGNVNNPQTVPGSGVNRSAISFRNDVEAFSGFKSAVEACYLDWEDYPLPSITYVSGVNRLYHCPFTCFRHGESARPDNLVNSSQAVLNCEPPMLHHDHHHHHHHHHPRHHHHKPHHHAPKRQMRINNFVEFSYMDCRHLGGQFPLCPVPIGGLPGAVRARDDGNRSSVSSEGFCENDADPDILNDTFAGSGLQGIAADSELRECATGSESSSSGTSGLAPGEKWQGGGTTRASLGGVPVPVPGGLGYYPVYEMAYPPKPASDFSLAMAPDPAAAASAPRQVREEPAMPPASPLALDGDSDSSGSTGSPRGDREASRRPSKDESSNSDSQQSGDEYHVYYYDPKALACHAGNAEKLKAPEAKQDEPGSPLSSASVFANLKKMEDPWEILLARAEGLHAHGHGREACTLAVQLAEELLANPPDLMIELPPMPTKNKRKKKVNPVSHQLSCLASATLAKCAFLCTVLAENADHSHLAFRVGLFGLEMARPPASTKPLEVKLANQETELVCLLKRIPLGPWELKVIRERAEQLKTGTLRSRGDALLPIVVASFIFEALAVPPERGPHIVAANAAGREQRCQLQSLGLRLPTDEALGFEAAVAALGLKANVSEADHPLLCEGTRRQRGDLAIALLVYYKDEPSKIARIMEKLLDREIHMLVKVPIPTSHYSANPGAKIQLPSRRREDSVCSEPMVPSTSEPLLIDSAAVSGAGSRPHSSTSAELEQGLSALALGGAPPPGSVSQVAGIPRSKESTRYKGKRAYPSIPNQPSEAGAHFMFELAKTVLTKAGGNSSTSLFTQASTSQNHHGPHRSLHICAFQIGLYALGLHNCVSPNWLSRTYSSHVSWITGQAMEIGAPAISFLIETWEGHLTPPEAASIADRASRGRDRNIVHSAAELALSCLPHSHALNPNEIQRAILQCKEQSDSMLEQACLTVEAAAKGGGVYPEVLFQVAKYWYELYMRNVPGGEHMDSEVPPEAMAVDSHGTLLAMVEPAQEMPPPSGAVQPVVVTTAAPPPPYPSHHPAVTTLAMSVPYSVGPYSFAVQGLHFGGPMAHRPVALPPPPHLQMYHLSPPAFQYPPHAASPYLVASAPPHHMYPLPPGAAPSQGLPPPPAGSSASGSPQQVGNGMARPRQSFSQVQVRYLLAAYRVGMLALETLSRRVHDDRPQAKYARNPPYGEDAKWLLRISKKLGTQYLHQFCICAVSSIVSPYVLHDIALEAGQYLARNNPSLLGQHLRSALLPLVQKCQQMYIQCLHQKLYHLTTGDYEDFVNIVCSARAAFQITPEGSTQFKEWLQSIRRSKSCKKDLWAQINAALQANSK